MTAFVYTNGRRIFTHSCSHTVRLSWCTALRGRGALCQDRREEWGRRGPKTGQETLVDKWRGEKMTMAHTLRHTHSVQECCNSRGGKWITAVSVIFSACNCQTVSVVLSALCLSPAFIFFYLSFTHTHTQSNFFQPSTSSRGGISSICTLSLPLRLVINGLI